MRYLNDFLFSLFAQRERKRAVCWSHICSPPPSISFPHSLSCCRSPRAGRSWDQYCPNVSNSISYFFVQSPQHLVGLISSKRLEFERLAPSWLLASVGIGIDLSRRLEFDLLHVSQIRSLGLLVASISFTCLKFDLLASSWPQSPRSFMASISSLRLKFDLLAPFWRQSSRSPKL